MIAGFDNESAVASPSSSISGGIGINDEVIASLAQNVTKLKHINNSSSQLERSASPQQGRVVTTSRLATLSPTDEESDIEWPKSPENQGQSGGVRYADQLSPSPGAYDSINALEDEPAPIRPAKISFSWQQQPKAVVVTKESLPSLPTIDVEPAGGAHAGKLKPNNAPVMTPDKLELVASVQQLNEKLHSMVQSQAQDPERFCFQHPQLPNGYTARPKSDEIVWYAPPDPESGFRPYVVLPFGQGPEEHFGAAGSLFTLTPPYGMEPVLSQEDFMTFSRTTAPPKPHFRSSRQPKLAGHPVYVHGNYAPYWNAGPTNSQPQHPPSAHLATSGSSTVVLPAPVPAAAAPAVPVAPAMPTAAVLSANVKSMTKEMSAMLLGPVLPSDVVTSVEVAPADVQPSGVPSSWRQSLSPAVLHDQDDPSAKIARMQRVASKLKAIPAPATAPIGSQSPPVSVGPLSPRPTVESPGSSVYQTPPPRARWFAATPERTMTTRSMTNRAMSSTSSSPANSRASTSSKNTTPRLTKPVPVPRDAYLRTASRPATKLIHGAQPLLVIMDLNGTLLDRNSTNRTKFKARPCLEEFLSYIFGNPKETLIYPMIWTSAKPENCAGMLDSLLTPERRARCVAVWARDRLGLSSREYMDKVQVYKNLEQVWLDNSIQQSHPLWSDEQPIWGTWGQHNTLLIDDSILKGAWQPHNLVNVLEFKRGNMQMEKSIGELQRVIEWIKVAREYADVSVLGKGMPFKSGV